LLDSMKISEVECKTALSRSTLPGLEYSLNPYRGCMHNCAYCYAPYVLRLPRDDWGKTVSVKKNIPLVLSKELKTKKHGVVGISTVTDPYQPVEKTYQLTRLCLEQLLHYDFPAHVQTKSALVTRDLDLLSRFSDAQVMFSIGTIRENERKILEPGSSPIQTRFAALKQCSEAGVRTAVFFGPMYPTITLGEISSFLDTIKEAGVEELWVDRLRLRPGIWENMQKTLQDNKEIFEAFTYHVREEKKDYEVLRENLLKKAKQRNLKLIDAF
jgi:DNA repair photolyase